MAILANVETIHGETKKLYLRVNNVEVNNHGASSLALVRGFISESAFIEGKSYIHEENLQFNPDVRKPIWEQAYIELKDKYLNSVDC